MMCPVAPTSEEPEPGWVDNIQGVMGAVTAISTGMLHTIMSINGCQANIVPVDKVVNGIIALVFAVATQKWKCPKDEKSVPVVNFVAKSCNCIYWADFRDYVSKFVYETPSQKLLWYPFLTTPQHLWTATLYNVLLHKVPAAVVDFFMWICGKPTKLRKLYKTLDKYLVVIDYFCTHQFNFEETNSDLLWEMLEPEDKQLFAFNMADLDWAEFMRVFVLGCRRHLLKEDDSTLESSRSKIKILYCIHMVAKGACMVLASWCLWGLVGTSFS